MTINKLIKILNQAPDKTRDVYIFDGGIVTTDIGHSFDDDNNIRLYEIVKDE